MAWLDKNPVVEHYFFSHIAGVTHVNLDGTSRQAVLCCCKPRQILILKWEKDNPVSNMAIAVHLETGEQLGYLESRVGEDTLKRLRKGEILVRLDPRASAVPEHVDREVLGAIIAVIKLKRRSTESSPPANSFCP